MGGLRKKPDATELKKFNVYGKVVASTFVGEYEAANAAQAIEKATDDAHVSVCHYCANKIEDPEVTDLTAEEAS